MSLDLVWVIDTSSFIAIKEEVMASAGSVVDKHKTEEDADAYVLALALRFAKEGRRTCVVTNDYRDKGGRLSMATACEKHLGLPTMRLKSFLQLSGLQSRIRLPRLVVERQRPCRLADPCRLQLV
jgi:hypothetical protein